MKSGLLRCYDVMLLPSKQRMYVTTKIMEIISYDMNYVSVRFVVATQLKGDTDTDSVSIQ